VKENEERTCSMPVTERGLSIATEKREHNSKAGVGLASTAAPSSQCI
jgi:hypothetical protein